MALTPDQVSELKKQLSDQIKHLPAQQRAAAQKQIEDMSASAIEEMLDQQKSSQKPIFRAIVSGDIPSKVIEESKDAIAVLDIKPISQGHIVIIPKKQAKDPKDIATSIFSLAKKLAKRITSKLKAKSAEILPESKFGEAVINVIPVYDKPVSLESPRLEIPEPQLAETAYKLKVIPKKPVIKKATKKSSAISLPRRIP